MNLHSVENRSDEESLSVCFKEGELRERECSRNTELEPDSNGHVRQVLAFVHTCITAGARAVKNLPPKAGGAKAVDLIPRSGRSPGEGHGNLLQCSCLENPMDRGAWDSTVHGVAKSWNVSSASVGRFLLTVPPGSPQCDSDVRSRRHLLFCHHKGLNSERDWGGEEKELFFQKNFMIWQNIFDVEFF